MKTFKILIPVIAFVFLTTTSCRKKETVEVDNETQSVIDNAVAEQEFMGVVPVVNAHAIKTKGTGADANKVMAACDTLVLKNDGGSPLYFDDPINNPIPPTYYLYMSNPTCNPIPDGKLRQGHLEVTLYGRPKTVGSRMLIKMVACKAANVDPNKMITYECDSMVVTTEINDTINDIRQFKFRIYKGKCVGAGGSWTTYYETNRTIRHEYSAANNLIKVWGSSNGTNRQGRKFNVVVNAATPLIKRDNCQFVSFGKMELTPEGFKTRTIDFTSGTGVDACDDDATFSVNGNTVPFKLK